MKASFKCGVCGEKLTLTGTPDGIERARVMWLTGHEHLSSVVGQQDVEHDPAMVVNRDAARWDEGEI